MNSQATLITFPTKTGKGALKEVVTTGENHKEVESYENIIQNLALLKSEARNRNHGEAEAIEKIRANLSFLRDAISNLPSYDLQTNIRI